MLWPMDTQSPGSSAAACSPPRGANCPKCLYLVITSYQQVKVKKGKNEEKKLHAKIGRSRNVDAMVNVLVMGYGCFIFWVFKAFYKMAFFCMKYCRLYALIKCKKMEK